MTDSALLIRGETMPKRLLISLISACVAIGTALSAVPAPAEAPRQAHFVAAGDFGATPATTSVLRGMRDASPSAALALGDLKYQDVATEAQWCAYVTGIVGPAMPFELIAGNHDSLDDHHGLIENFAACLPNRIAGMRGTYGKEYVLDFPQQRPLVRVITASPGLKFSDGIWDYRAGDAHYKWLRAAIDGGRAAGAKWIIVAAHRPCWSVGVHACPTSTDFYNLLLRKRVDLVLVGHEHSYERTHQLASGVAGCRRVPVGVFDPDCVRDRDGSFAAGAGTVFATVGTGGRPLRDANMSHPQIGYFGAVSGANLSSAYGFLDIKVGEGALAARFVATTGSFSDSFTINRR